MEFIKELFLLLDYAHWKLKMQSTNSRQFYMWMWMFPGIFSLLLLIYKIYNRVSLNSWNVFVCEYTFSALECNQKYFYCFQKNNYCGKLCCVHLSFMQNVFELFWVFNTFLAQTNRLSGVNRFFFLIIIFSLWSLKQRFEKRSKRMKIIDLMFNESNIQRITSSKTQLV